MRPRKSGCVRLLDFPETRDTPAPPRDWYRAHCAWTTPARLIPKAPENPTCPFPQNLGLRTWLPCSVPSLQAFSAPTIPPFPMAMPSTRLDEKLRNDIWPRPPFNNEEVASTELNDTLAKKSSV